MLAGPLLAGRLGVANAYGTAVGDDKLTHAYVHDIIRYYLGEKPLVPSVETLDLARPEHMERALDTLESLVVKPRRGHGGIGVVIAEGATRQELDALRERVRADPAGHVAQPLVRLSRHPTVIGDGVAARHVDLRPFVFLHGPDEPHVLPGGLTRVALEEGAMVVNSTQSGGAKDTWVV
jgi:uncharacterized circularly permuted ATP-grasp superfamily protein